MFKLRDRLENFKKLNMFLNLLHFLGPIILGVCDKVAKKIGAPIERIRLYFIYSAFLTLGVSMSLYLALSLIIELRKIWRKSIKRPVSVWNL